MIRNALLLSDIHLGWVPCTPAHRELLDHLPAAAGDAELIVLNGDIIDGHREVHAAERELVDRLVALCAQWRREGRTVVYVEGNHDPVPSPLGDSVWSYTFEGVGERVLVLHGHRFDGAPFEFSPYERIGRHAIALENAAYARSSTLRAIYARGGGWLAGAWGFAEDRLWRPRFPAQLAPLVDGPFGTIDTIAHGHYHFGPGHSTDLGRPAWRTGAWVSRGHFGTVDRMLRYRDGRWERIALDRGRWRATDDGR